TPPHASLSSGSCLRRRPPAPPLFPYTTLFRSCSGSIAWWLCCSASDWAACNASCALIVNLSSLILGSPLIRARVVSALRFELLVEVAFYWRQVVGHHDLHRDDLVSRPAPLEAWHPIARQPERAAARGGRGDPHRHAALERRDLDGRAQRGLRRR